MSCMKYEVWLAHSLYKGGGRGGGGVEGGTMWQSQKK